MNNLRHLWLAFREGLVEHRRALGSLLALAVALLIVIQLVSFVVAYNSNVCGSCHIMKPYIEAWRASSHRDTACVTCHAEWRFLISPAYFRYATGLYDVNLRAEVPDRRCLTCHEKQDIDTDQMFLKGIHFSHDGHLGEMRRGKTLHCTSCHGSHTMMAARSEAPGGDVQREVCFTCHFKGAEAGQAVTGCLVCHGPPTTVVTHQGFEFDHESYIKRDVRCDHCHTEVTRGDANVPREKCQTCHVSRIEAFEDLERVHEIHLRQEQIDCDRCHNEIEHGRFGMAAALGEACENCHRPQHTPQEQMYIGIGGEGVPDTPAPMFLARVACDSCHGEPGGDPRVGAEQLRRSCVNCHGAGFDRMVDDWIGAMETLTADVRTAIRRAEGLARTDEHRAALERARRNLEFVRRGRGEHNIHYATALLRLARTDAETVLRARGGGALPAQPLLASAAGYCQVCHSTSHLAQPVAFEGGTYEHTRHLQAGISCDACHSLEEHGVTTINRDGCMSCHHGPEQKRECAACHEEQASFYQGSLLGTEVKGDPDIMAQAGVECAGCHDLGSKLSVVATVQQACVGCHEAGYDEMLVEWINEDQERVQELAVLIARARSSSAAAANRQAIASAERIQRALVAAHGAHNTALAADAATRAKKLLEPALPK